MILNVSNYKFGFELKKPKSKFELEFEIWERSETEIAHQPNHQNWIKYFDPYCLLPWYSD